MTFVSGKSAPDRTGLPKPPGVIVPVSEVKPSQTRIAQAFGIFTALPAYLFRATLARLGRFRF